MPSSSFLIVHAPAESAGTVFCILRESKFPCHCVPTMAILRAEINGETAPPMTASNKNYYAVKIPSDTGWDRVNSLMDKLRVNNINFTYTTDVNEGISVNGEEKPFSHMPDDVNIPNEESDDDVQFLAVVKKEPADEVQDQQPPDNYLQYGAMPTEGTAKPQFQLAPDVHGQQLVDSYMQNDFVQEPIGQMQEFDYIPQNLEANSTNAVKDETGRQSRDDNSSGYHTTTDILTTSSSGCSQQHQLDHAAVDEELACQNPVKEDKVFPSKAANIKLQNISSNIKVASTQLAYRNDNPGGSNDNFDMDDPLLWETMNRRATRGKRFDYTGFFPKDLDGYIKHPPHNVLSLAFEECTHRYNQTIQEKSLRNTGNTISNNRKRGTTEVKPFQKPEPIQESNSNQKRKLKEMKPLQTQNETIPKRPRGRPRKIKVPVENIANVPVAPQTASLDGVSTTPAVLKRQRCPRRKKVDQNAADDSENDTKATENIGISETAVEQKKRTRSCRKKAVREDQSAEGDDSAQETWSSSETSETVAPLPKRRRRAKEVQQVVFVANPLQTAKLIAPSSRVTESEKPKITPINRKTPVKDVFITGDDTDEETDRIIDDLMAATSLPSTSKQSEIPLPSSSKPAEENDEDEDDIDEMERTRWVGIHSYVCKKNKGLPGHFGEVTVSNYCENPVGLQFYCNLCKKHEFIPTEPQKEMPPLKYVHCRFVYGVQGHIGNIMYVDTRDNGVNVTCSECRMIFLVKFP